MSNASRVTVFETIYDFFKYAFGIILFESSLRFRFKITVQRASTNIFHDKDNVLLSIDDLVQLNNIGLSHFLHQFNFSLDRFSSIWLLKFVLFVNFHGYFLVGRFMKTNSHNSVSSLTYLLPYNVVIKRCFLRENHCVI
jgi:hypothetical protein